MSSRTKSVSTLNRRQMLIAALAGGSTAAIAGQSVATELSTQDLWVGFDDRITQRTLAEAEKLFGLEFSEAERQQILGGPVEIDEEGVFATQVKLLKSRREYNIPPTVPPATRFDPRLPGIKYRVQEHRVTLSEKAATPLPSNPEDIAFASLTSQRQWLDRGDITSLALTDIYLDRIKRYGEQLKCFVTVTAQVARKQAIQADTELREGRVRSPLHGIPFGIKDLFDTAGIKTTWGAMPYKSRIAETDATVVRLLHESGAVMLGKTTLGALAWGDVWFGGETRNPWNPKEGASGSSAGSGSATAAGLCAFAIGTETLGSIVSPSDRNGVAGLRPSFGRVSRVGAMPLSWSLDKIGPMCRYVEDTALVLATLNSFDEYDTGCIDQGFEYNGATPIESLTIGYDPSWFEGKDASSIDAQALKAIRRLGATLKQVSLPKLPVEEILHPLFVESAASFEQLTLSDSDDELRRQTNDAWPNFFRQARYYSAVDFVQGERLRSWVMQQTQEFFSQVDVIFGPTFGNPMLQLTNLTGQPSLTIPAGFEESTPRPLFGHPENKTDNSTRKVPRSITLWGNLFEEGKLLNVGQALEEALGAAKQHPVLG